MIVLEDLEGILNEIVGEAVGLVVDRKRWRNAIARTIAARELGTAPAPDEDTSPYSVSLLRKPETGDTIVVTCPGKMPGDQQKRLQARLCEQFPTIGRGIGLMLLEDGCSVVVEQAPGRVPRGGAGVAIMPRVGWVTRNDPSQGGGVAFWLVEPTCVAGRWMHPDPAVRERLDGNESAVAEHLASALLGLGLGGPEAIVEIGGALFQSGEGR